VICALSERHAVPDFVDLSIIDVDTQVDEAQISISDVKASSYVHQRLKSTA
jgi:hypothetical protein